AWHDSRKCIPNWAAAPRASGWRSARDSARRSPACWPPPTPHCTAPSAAGGTPSRSPRTEVVREERFILLGDAVWLDFVNTARGRQPNPPDRLPALPAWEAWLDALQLPRAT